MFSHGLWGILRHPVYRYPMCFSSVQVNIVESGTAQGNHFDPQFCQLIDHVFAKVIIDKGADRGKVNRQRASFEGQVRFGMMVTDWRSFL